MKESQPLPQPNHPNAEPANTGLPDQEDLVSFYKTFKGRDNGHPNIDSGIPARTPEPLSPEDGTMPTIHDLGKVLMERRSTTPVPNSTRPQHPMCQPRRLGDEISRSTDRSVRHEPLQAEESDTVQLPRITGQGPGTPSAASGPGRHAAKHRRAGNGLLRFASFGKSTRTSAGKHRR